jgi:hypothetical protein
MLFTLVLCVRASCATRAKKLLLTRVCVVTETDCQSLVVWCVATSLVCSTIDREAARGQEFPIDLDLYEQHHTEELQLVFNDLQGRGIQVEV